MTDIVNYQLNDRKKNGNSTSGWYYGTNILWNFLFNLNPIRSDDDDDEWFFCSIDKNGSFYKCIHLIQVVFLIGEDLFQFQTTVLYCYRDSDESSVAGTTYMTPDEGQYVVDPPVRIAPEDYHRMNGYIGNIINVQFSKVII